MSIKTDIILKLRRGADHMTGTELLDIAEEVERLFDKKLYKEEGSKLTCGDIDRCPKIFTAYHLKINE